MTPVHCDAIRARLDAFHDGELEVGGQVLVREHVENCAACAREYAEMERLRRALRAVPIRREIVIGPPAGWAEGLLEQARVERQLSWHTWLLAVFDDMHFVWPAMGATAAVLVCLLASAQVMQATNEQRPDSLAGVIEYLASPGSNGNPARIDGFTKVPRLFESANWPVGMTSEDAVLALSAVVTREGRIQSIEMLAAEQARALKVKPEVGTGDAGRRIACAIRAGASRRCTDRRQHGVGVGAHDRGWPGGRRGAPAAPSGPGAVARNGPRPSTHVSQAHRGAHRTSSAPRRTRRIAR